MADQGYFTRRGAVTTKLTVLGVGAPRPAPGRLTSAARHSVGMRQVPDYKILLRPSKGVNLQVPHTGATLVFKIRGFYNGDWETWVSTIGPLVPPPSGHAVTNVSFTMTSID
jgi:hypothetical protein